MIRLLLHSRQPGLQSQLISASGGYFSVSVDSNRDRVTELVLHEKCDVVVLDLECCPADDPFGFLEELQNLDVPVVVVSGDGTRKTALELFSRGVQSYYGKPVAIQELNSAVRQAHEHAGLKRELAERREQSTHASGCGQLIGSSAGSQLVYDLIRRVANLDAFVLITGESGTGKELIARAIHSLGNRKQNQFVAVSCGAIPESLIEAELFGCERGAYTGASARRAGYFEEAGNGTLLLDEIGELSHHTQVKLLRVLQQREFTRLGSGKAIPLAARVLFATNRNLKRMVEEGAFREDLYYRLNVIGIQSQPLRDRRDEISQLAQHFLAKYARAYRKTAARFEPHAMALLTEYAWPGNVRELENVMQSALILSDDETIRASNLPEEIQQTDLKCLDMRSSGLRSNDLRSGDLRSGDLRSGDLRSGDETLQWASFEEQLRDYKVKLAFEAVKGCNGNKTLAAQSLNISRTYLHRLIREPGEDCPDLKVA